MINPKNYSVHAWHHSTHVWLLGQSGYSFLSTQELHELPDWVTHLPTSSNINVSRPIRSYFSKMNGDWWIGGLQSGKNRLLLKSFTFFEICNFTFVPIIVLHSKLKSCLSFSLNELNISSPNKGLLKNHCCEQCDQIGQFIGLWATF